MGGMGTIHSDNGATIYGQNHTMTQNLLRAIDLPRADGLATLFFYASSACVYPQALQTDKDASLRESVVFSEGIPQPQGLYGLEKLNSELLLAQSNKTVDIRIARFHNIYGPGGAWNNGREKVPAAFLRKALACRYLAEKYGVTPDFEIWGDGAQRRSFLYIDDAVDAILKLLSSSYSKPVNIGSDHSVTIQQLAELALRYAGTNATFTYDGLRPIGVGNRNSNNELSKSVLDWAPSVSLEEGIAKTLGWLQAQVDAYLAPHEQDNVRLRRSLQNLLSSWLVSLDAERLTFAILLPVTSRGSPDPNDCLTNLHDFIQSLKETTWRDTHPSLDQSFRYIIYLAIDADDDFLRGDDKAYRVLLDLGIPSTHVRLHVNSTHPRGHVCGIWRDCARQAHKDGCDYFILMGDDVKLRDEGWMRKSHSAFTSLSQSSHLPFGLGCVAFTDESFPGMPTFPIVHKTHLDIFGGEIVPDIFVNQDGDPFLFQLYRRWGTSTMFPCRITNTIGGSVEARYVKRHATNWSLAPLVQAERTVTSYLQNHADFTPSRISATEKLTLDVIIPCYRVDLTVLSSILSLEAPSTTSVNFIIIIDDPDSPYTPALLHKYSSNPSIRIRINKSNLGASYSRNRGLSESAAEWVHFLDDDVVPSPDLLHAVSDSIRTNPDAAGFVCNTRFPPADSIFTTAVHLSGVTYFWDIATKIGVDIPWGVTANLVARRVLTPPSSEPDSDLDMGVIPPPTTFSLSYPKTGGGEDIDYCLTQRSTHFSLFHQGTTEYPGFLAAPGAVVTHPWWNQGQRSYWRFHKWSIGDGHLIAVYPELTFRDYAPNSAEFSLLCVALFALGTVTQSLDTAILSVKVLGCVFLANAVHDVYRHMTRHPERTQSLNITPRIRQNPIFWLLAVVESSFIRMFSELGRLRGIVEKGEWGSLGKRFDWFVGRIPGGGPKKEERRNSVERAVLALVFLAIFRGLAF